MSAFRVFLATSVLACSSLFAIGGEFDVGPPSTSVRAVDSTGVIGPDLIVADLQNTVRFGRVGDVTAYAAGNVACNIGDERVGWFANTNRHPVLVQNMYRLKDGRFEQIGMAWAWHAFFALSHDFCGPCTDPTDGSQLGVGCSDTSSANLNGAQNFLGLRSGINAYTGDFPYPFTAPPPDPTIGRRLQVHDADIDPALNSGALYFIEAQYVASDDAQAANGGNNNSYRPIVVVETAPGEFNLAVIGAAQQSDPAIRAWGANDPDVTEVDVAVPNEGVFVLAGKAIYLGAATWRYEYAVQNINSDRALGSFSIPVPPGTTVSNVGFHDVDYHSGEVYDGTDWAGSFTGTEVTWSTTDYSVDPDANALRFGTLYNFWFEANAEPTATTATLGLFKPGSPTELTAPHVGPGTIVTVPLEDECSSYIPLTRGVPFVGSTAAASGTGTCSCSTGDTKDVWHCWTADCTGSATISLCDSLFDTTLAIYDACGGTELACNDDGACSNPAASLISPAGDALEVTAGETYYIRVSGYNGDSGQYTIEVEDCLTPPPDPEACCLAAGGSCLDSTAVEECIGIGGTPAGPGSVCLGDGNGNGVDDACEPPGCCFVAFCIDSIPVEQCFVMGGTPADPGSFCLGDGNGNGVDDACEPPAGACCLSDDAVCAVLEEADCLAQAGTYLGDSVSCGGDCDSDGRDDACSLGAPITASKVYWADEGSGIIQRADFDGSNVETIVASETVIPSNLAIHWGLRKIYWTDIGPDRIQRADLDGGNVEDVVTGLQRPADIALDTLAGKMYWVDRNADTISRANIDGSNIEIILSAADGLDFPEALALDPSAGKLYWINRNPRKIQRADLDGSAIEDLVTESLANNFGIALDLTAGRMYWTNAQTGAIRRADLDGSNVEDFITGLSFPHGVDLDLAAGKIYWTDITTDTLHWAYLANGIAHDLVTGLDTPRGIALAPRNCVTFADSGSGLWSDSASWPGLAAGTFPDDVTSAAGVYVTIPAPSDVMLDVTATVPSLTVSDGATLRITNIGDTGDLYFSSPARFLTFGRVYVDGARVIDLVSDGGNPNPYNPAGGGDPSPLIVGPEGVYEGNPTPWAPTISASLIAGNAVIQTGWPDSNGGTISLTDAMSLTTFQDLVMEGDPDPMFGAVTANQNVGSAVQTDPSRPPLADEGAISRVRLPVPLPYGRGSVLRVPHSSAGPKGVRPSRSPANDGTAMQIDPSRDREGAVNVGGAGWGRHSQPMSVRPGQSNPRAVDRFLPPSSRWGSGTAAGTPKTWPTLSIEEQAEVDVSGRLVMTGIIESVNTSTVPVTLKGDFDNQAMMPSLFDWTAGTLTLDGSEEQTFEVAGLDLGPFEDGFLTDQDTLFDMAPHTNNAIGTLRIGAAAGARASLSYGRGSIEPAGFPDPSRDHEGAVTTPTGVAGSSHGWSPDGHRDGTRGSRVTTPTRPGGAEEIRATSGVPHSSAQPKGGGRASTAAWAVSASAAATSVRFANDFANTAGSGACAEALYVDHLILELGTTITLDEVRVYYRTLDDQGATINTAGCGALLPVQACPSSSVPAAAMADVGFGSATRHLAIQAGDAGRSQAIRVTFTDLEPPYDIWNGTQMWVQAPQERCEHANTVSPPCPGGASYQAATLGCNAHYLDWTTVGTLYVRHEGIIPRSSYTVEVIAEVCDTNDPASFSTALPMDTSRMGDCCGDATGDPPNGSISLADVNGILFKFANAGIAPIKARVDHAPGNVDHRIDLLDVNAALQGFANVPYPETPSVPDPCP